MGGLVSDLVSRNVYEIDTNMNMLDREAMKTGRFNATLALVNDRFIFAIGGSIAKGRPTDIVECFDSIANAWYPVAPLSKPRSCTTACNIANKYIFVFPGP